MSAIKRRLTIAAAGIVIASAFSAPASAGTGCNGVVNWLVWGCAGWDNKNGPQFPYYHKREVSVALRKGAQVTVKDGSAALLINGQLYPIVGGLASIVAQGGGNVIKNANGSNVINTNGSNVISNDGGTIKVWSAN